jgi:hypothetical protein
MNAAKGSYSVSHVAVLFLERELFMIEQLLVIWFYVGPGFGLPLLVIGAILRLCEGSWGKGRGEMGSTRFLIVGLLLSLPFVYYFAMALLS